MHQAVKQAVKAIVPGGVRQRLKTLRHQAAHFGLRWQCPLCRSRLKAFLPFGCEFPVLRAQQVVGGSRRPNAICPVCGALDRERLLYLYLARKTDLFLPGAAPKRVLHVAPEARLSQVLAAQGHLDYLTADLEPAGVAVRMDVTDIRYPDGHFDVIICNHVLEHVPDDAKAMAELYRTLKPGGWAMLQVPIALALERTHEDPSITAPSAREQAFGQRDHVRLYGRDYRDRLARAGFAVEEYHWRDEAGLYGGRRNPHGLIEAEAIYRAGK